MFRAIIASLHLAATVGMQLEKCVFSDSLPKAIAVPAAQNSPKGQCCHGDEHYLAVTRYTAIGIQSKEFNYCPIRPENPFNHAFRVL